MNHKYIRKNKDSFSIVKGSRNYGRFSNLEDTLFLRDKLIENCWNVDLIDETYNLNGIYLVVKPIDDRLHVLARSDEKPSAETIEKLTKSKIRNPNNSKYGLNISRVFDTYIITKRIAGDDYIFGYYDNLEDAEFVRNHLMDHNWDVNAFSQVEHVDDTETFKVVEVIDDKIYVLATFKSKENIDIAKCHEDFLSKIAKHKLGLASHPHLDELVDKIPELEVMFDAKAKDDVWSFEDSDNPLGDIIFKLTPFQKSVYDAVENSTFDDIRRALIRFKSGNFDEKIQRNLDELEEMGLIGKNGDCYFRI